MSIFDYPQRTGAKITLRERGWKWDSKARCWVLEVHGVRIIARSMDAALIR